MKPGTFLIHIIFRIIYLFQEGEKKLKDFVSSDPEEIDSREFAKLNHTYKIFYKLPLEACLSRESLLPEPSFIGFKQRMNAQ